MISSEKIQELRQQLRDGRGITDKTAGSRGGDDPPAGTNFQITGRAIESLSAKSGGDDQNRRVADIDQRSIETKSVGKRQRSGRPRQDHSSSGSGGETSTPETIIGNLEATGPVRVRLDKPQATFSKEEPKSPPKGKKSPKSEGFSTFGDKEAEEMSSELPRVLMGHFEDIDEYLWNRQKQKFGSSDERAVWSDLDEDDCIAIATAWVKVGRKNRYVAEAARVTVDSSAYIKTVILVSPRFRQTAQILRETYIPRKSRLQRNATPD